MTDTLKSDDALDASREYKFAQLKKLREQFEAHHISKLPKPTKKQTDDVKANFQNGRRCTICGTWHHPDVVHLDYVGHAAVTHRLLEVDPEWDWEPMALDGDGLPKIDKDGGLWIYLTICGVRRKGYGDAGAKSGADAMKERIGDAIRNAAMRFGVALDLWHKGQLHADTEPPATDTTLADKWIFKARVAEDLVVLADIWSEGIVEIEAAADRYAYDEFKVAVAARKKELKGVAA